MNDFFGKGASKYARDVYKDVHKIVENSDRSFTLWPINSTDIFKDPKRIGFQLARYKFISKILRCFKQDFYRCANTFSLCA